MTIPLSSLTGNKVARMADALNLENWLMRESALNGLYSTDLHPWHIIVSYDQFDEDGDNVHSGVYEESWAGPKEYKRMYKSDNLNQTDYATERGLFRQGDQTWPDAAQLRVRAEVLDPFNYAATLEDVYAQNMVRVFGNYKLHCVLIVRHTGISDPTQYCFEPDSSILRYSRGFGWLQTAYNRIMPFQGRNLAHEVDVTDGGKPYLKLRVETIELIPEVKDTYFVPPADAKGPLGNRVSGVPTTSVRTPFVQWPASLRAKHFRVRVEIVIGKDGHVLSAHAISGPPEAFKAAEKAAREWTFRPYLVLGVPVEVEQTVEFSNN